MSDSDTPYTSIKRKGQGSRPQKKKTRSSGPLEDEDDTPTPRSLRKRTNKHENGDSNEFGDKPRSKRRKLFHRVYKTHIKSLCDFVLEGMMEHKFASPFMHPVDTNKYPSYLDKVKEPMDFSTIKKKMDKDTYTEAEDFAMDVRLIFKNCLTFNDHESDLVFMAQSLRKLFEEAFTEIKRREKRYLDDLEFEEMKQLIEDLKNEHQRMLTELNRLVSAASPKLTTTDANASVEAPKKEKKPKRPWDLKRKEELSRAISSLNETQVSDLLIPFITALIPGCLSSGDLELDLANQPEEKLTKLEKWVKKTLKSGDVNGHVDIDGVSSDSASESEKKIVAATSQTQVSAPEIKSTEEPKHVSEESSTREEKDKKDDKPPELEMEPHPISSKTTIVQTTTEEKTEDASSTTSLPKSDPVDIMQVDNAQVDSASEQKAVETTEPRAVEMTEATITTQS